MAIRITSELGFIYFVNGKTFANKNEAERYYNKLVDKERKDATHRRRSSEIGRIKRELSSDDSN